VTKRLGSADELYSHTALLLLVICSSVFRTRAEYSTTKQWICITSCWCVD